MERIVGKGFSFDPIGGPPKQAAAAAVSSPAPARNRSAVVDTVIAEAGGEGPQGMQAVANVIKNRADKAGTSPDDVVRAPHQFEGYGKKVDPRQRAQAEQIVNAVFDGQAKDITGGADHFHADSVAPDWANKMPKTTRIGGHTFYASGGGDGGQPLGITRKQESLKGRTRFNWASKEKLGDPNSAKWQADNLTTIEPVKGQRWTVYKPAAAAFDGLIKDLAAAGYPVSSSGGFNYRNIRGSDKLSQHAFGTAIDLNSATNPMLKGKLKTDLPNNIREIAAKHGLAWGGDFKGRPDPMHFEYVGKEGGGNGDYVAKSGLQRIVVNKDTPVPKDSIPDFGGVKSFDPTERFRIEAAQVTMPTDDPTDMVNAQRAAKGQPPLITMPADKFAKWHEKWEADQPGVLQDFGNLMWTGWVKLGQAPPELIKMLPGGDKIVAAGDAINKWVTGQTAEEQNAANVALGEKSLSAATKSARQKEWWDSEKGELGSAWSDPRAYMAGVAESLPATAITMIPAFTLARGARLAALAKGATPAVAAATAARTALVAGGIGEGLEAGGSASKQVRDELAALPEEVWQASEAFKTLVDGGMTPEDAKKAITDDKATQAGLVAGTITGVIGGRGDMVLQNIINKGLKGTLKKRILKGAATEAAAEALEETGQSASEQAAANVAVGGVDPSRSPTEGVLNAALGGAVTGGIMGAGMGGVAGGLSKDEAATAPAGADAAANAGGPAGGPGSPSIGPIGSDVAIIPPNAHGRGAAAGSGAPGRPKGPLERAMEHGEQDAQDVVSGQFEQAGAPKRGTQVIIDYGGGDLTFSAKVIGYSVDGSAQVVDDDGEVHEVPPEFIKPAMAPGKHEIELTATARDAPAQSDPSVLTPPAEGAPAAPASTSETAGAAPTPEAPTVINKASLQQEFAGPDGSFDMRQLGDAVKTRVKTALDEGRPVNVVVEGKTKSIVGVTALGMKDQDGNPWGTAFLLQPLPGNDDRIEIGPLPSTEQAAGPTAEATKPASENAPVATPAKPAAVDRPEPLAEGWSVTPEGHLTKNYGKNKNLQATIREEGGRWRIEAKEPGGVAHGSVGSEREAIKWADRHYRGEFKLTFPSAEEEAAAKAEIEAEANFEKVGPARSKANPVLADYSTTREVDADIANMKRMQEHRAKLLGNKKALASYAVERGMSPFAMRQLLAENHAKTEERLPKVQAIANSPEFRKQRAAEKKGAKGVKFKDLPPDAQAQKDAELMRQMEAEEAARNLAAAPAAVETAVAQPSQEAAAVPSPVYKRGDKVALVSDPSKVGTVTKMEGPAHVKFKIPGEKVTRFTHVNEVTSVADVAPVGETRGQSEHERLLAAVKPIDINNVPDPTNTKPLQNDPKNTLVLIACSDAKKDTSNAPGKALPMIELYNGPLWQDLRAHGQAIPDRNKFVISGKWGFVSADTHVGQYDEKISKEKVDNIIEPGILENPRRPKGAKGMGGSTPYSLVHRSTIFDDEPGREHLDKGGPYTQVIIHGAGEYQRGFNAIVTQLQQAGVIVEGAPVAATTGTILQRRKQFNEFLRAATGAKETAPASVAGTATVAPVSAPKTHAEQVRDQTVGEIEALAVAAEQAGRTEKPWREPMREAMHKAGFAIRPDGTGSGVQFVAGWKEGLRGDEYPKSADKARIAGNSAGKKWIAANPKRTDTVAFSLSVPSKRGTQVTRFDIGDDAETLREFAARIGRLPLVHFQGGTLNEQAEAAAPAATAAAAEPAAAEPSAGAAGQDSQRVKVTAPEHLHAVPGKALDPTNVYTPVATGSSRMFGSLAPDTVELPLPLDDFKEITDEWAALFEAPAGKRVNMDKVAEQHGMMQPVPASNRISEWMDHAAAQQEDEASRVGNSSKTILSLFDFTGEWSRPYEEAGYNVIRFDYQNGQDIMEFGVDYFTENWDFGDVYGILIAPPCTDFANSGNRHKALKREDGRTEASKELVFQALRTVEYFRPKFWVLENPVGEIEKLTGLPPARMTFNPWNFGAPYTKKTVLWGSFNTDLPVAPVEPVEGSKMHSQYGGSSMKTKNARSETPTGFAYSFFLANNFADASPIERTVADYPEASGAVRAAMEAGLTESEVRDIMYRTYENYEYEEARSELARATAEHKAATPEKKTRKQIKAEEELAGAPARAKERAEKQIANDAAHGFDPIVQVVYYASSYLNNWRQTLDLIRRIESGEAPGGNTEKRIADLRGDVVEQQAHVEAFVNTVPEAQREHARVQIAKAADETWRKGVFNKWPIPKIEGYEEQAPPPKPTFAPGAKIAMPAPSETRTVAHANAEFMAAYNRIIDAGWSDQSVAAELQPMLQLLADAKQFPEIEAKNNDLLMKMRGEWIGRAEKIRGKVEPVEIGVNADGNRVLEDYRGGRTVIDAKGKREVEARAADPRNGRQFEVGREKQFEVVPVEPVVNGRTERQANAEFLVAFQKMADAGWTDAAVLAGLPAMNQFLDDANAFPNLAVREKELINKIKTDLRPRAIKESANRAKAVVAPKPKQPSKAERERIERRAALADYFAAGNVVESYSGYDIVRIFHPATDTTPWSVDVQSVVRGRDNEWMLDPARPDMRHHATMPDPHKIKAGPRERNVTLVGKLKPPPAAPPERTIPRDTTLIDGLDYKDLGIDNLSLGEHMGDEARDVVLERGREHGVESMIVIDAHGDIVANGLGAKNTVGFTNHLHRTLSDPAERTVMHHNHPSTNGLSAADIATARLAGLVAVYAHTIDGRSYRVEWTAAARMAVTNMKTGDVKDKIDTALSPLRRELARRANGDPQLEDILAREMQHLRAMALRDAGWIYYDVIGREDSRLLEEADIKAGYDKAVAALSRSVRGPLAAGNARRAGGYRHTGDLSSLHRGHENQAGQRAAQQGAEAGAGQPASGQPAPQAARAEVDPDKLADETGELTPQPGPTPARRGRKVLWLDSFNKPLPVTPTGGKKSKTIVVADVGRAFHDEHMKRVGRQLFPETSNADYRHIRELATRELANQMPRSNSGAGWYDADVQLAIDLTARVFPTLATNPYHRRLWLTFAGIFSTGINPEQAWMMTYGAFEHFIRTGEIPVTRAETYTSRGLAVPMSTFKSDTTGEMVTQQAGWGQRNPSNVQQLGLLKHIVATTGGIEQAIDWLQRPDVSRAEIDQMLVGSGLYKKGRYNTGPQLLGPPDWGMLVFSDKLGRYILGLQGLAEAETDTTVDLWFTRSYRRWTGRLFETPIGDQGVAAQPANDDERAAYFRLTGDLARAYALSIGDVQAILWFFEKRLWGAHGVRTQEGTSSSGARRLLASLGIDAGIGSGEEGVRADEQAGERAAPQEDRLQDEVERLTEQAKTPLMQRWLRASAVKTPVYHGTTGDFGAFSWDHVGTNTGHPTTWLGFWFSAKPEVASMFAGQYWDPTTWPARQTHMAGANLIPAYVRITNPFRMSARDFADMVNNRGKWRNAERTDPETFIGGIRDDLIAKGYDGVHIEGDRSLSESFGGDEYEADAWVAFKPNQIKSVHNTAPTESDDMLRDEVDDLPSGYTIDNPGGRWLEGKQATADRDIAAGTHGLYGSTTASAGQRKPLYLPIDRLKKLPGRNKEQPAPGKVKYDELDKSVGEKGYTNENPVFVMVNHHGKAYLNEGNNRVAVAAARGIPSVKAWVYWQNGAEQTKGPWDPRSVARMEQNADRLDDDVDRLDDIAGSFGEVGSAARDALAKLGRTLLNPRSAKLKERVSSLWSNATPGMLGAAYLNHLPDLAKGDVKARLQAYVDEKRAMDTTRNAVHTFADDIVKKWRKFTKTGPDNATKLATLMHDATIAGVDPNMDPNHPDALANRLKPEYPALRARFVALSPAGQALYTEVRDAYKKQNDALDNVLVDQLRKAHEIADRQKARELLRKIDAIQRSRTLTEDMKDEQMRKLRRDAQREINVNRGRRRYSVNELRRKLEANKVPAPYFPLGRFGRYFVEVRDDEGKLLHFAMAESEFESKQNEAEARREFPGDTVNSGILPEKLSDQTSVIKPSFIAEIEALLPNDENKHSIMDQIWQRYLRSSMPEASVRSRKIHRRRIAGYSDDALRVFANHMFHAAHQMAKLKHGLELNDIVDEAALEAQNAPQDETVLATQLIDELRKRHKWVMNPEGKKWAQNLSNMAFTWYLAASPAAAIVNIGQTPMVGIPVLGAKRGFGRAASALLRAARNHTGDRGLNANELRAMAAMTRSGLLGTTQAHDIRGVGETGIQYNPLKPRIMEKVSWAFEKAERINRRVTALAAFRLAIEDGASFDEAVKQASEDTWTIHFDYSNSSRPRMTQAPTWKVLMAMRAYQMNMLYRMGRDIHQMFKGATAAERKQARAQFGSILAMQALVAGGSGVAGYNTAFFLYGIMATMWAAVFGGGEDEDDPFTAQERFRENVLATLGPYLGGIVLNGVVGTVTGVDLAHRVGMPDLWFKSPLQDFKTGEETYTYYMMQSLGAPLSAVEQVVRGYDQLAQGNYLKAIETASPKGLKDPLKAYRYATEGLLTAKGDVVMDDVGTWAVIAQSMGFTPANIAEQWDQNSALKDAEARIKTNRQAYINSFAMAVKTGDMAGREEALEKIRHFNKSDYGRTMPIKGSSLSASIKNRAKATAKRKLGDGAYISNLALLRQLKLGIPATVE